VTGSVVLISIYELGRQSFAIASLAARLESAGARVSILDLDVSDFDPTVVRDADLVAIHVPMHTATRLASSVMSRVKSANPDTHICLFGLYAPINEVWLRELGADSVVGGEHEDAISSIYENVVGDRVGRFIQSGSSISISRPEFVVPDRSGFPQLEEYTRLQLTAKESRIVGYTEASRGCKHLCRHCPVVPVYEGRFVVVPPEIVVEDVRRQVRAGAQHITFGDPDFFNGPTHAMRVVHRLHDEFPDLTYDVTIKVEHLRTQSSLLPELVATGCVLVTSAIESFDDGILERFDKRHTREDLAVVVTEMQGLGLALNPTFVTFTPWTTLEGYVEFLESLFTFGMVDHISPVHYAIRLLIPAGSKLLELREVADLVDDFDQQQLVYPWHHPIPDVDRLFDEIVRLVQRAQASGRTRVEVFNDVWIAANAARGADVRPFFDPNDNEVQPVATIPYLTEPWYC
jgi:radical SAM superfamily enzyme YgiQ (UPF0313 family)